MIKVLACMFAVLVACSPAINDMCGFGCTQPVAPSCPLHQETPAPQPQCNHDHSGIRADLVRPLSIAPTIVALATMTAIAAVLPANTGLLAPAADSPSPPNLLLRLSVLRI